MLRWAINHWCDVIVASGLPPMPTDMWIEHMLAWNRRFDRHMKFKVAAETRRTYLKAGPFIRVR